MSGHKYLSLRKALIRAIKEGCLVDILYEGRQRVVEPHTLFEDQTGDLILNCWQVRGFSASAKPPWWRNLALSGMESIQILEERFSSARPGYRSQSAQFAKVIAELAPNR